MKTKQILTAAAALLTTLNLMAQSQLTCVINTETEKGSNNFDKLIVQVKTDLSQPFAKVLIKKGDSYDAVDFTPENYFSFPEGTKVVGASLDGNQNLSLYSYKISWLKNDKETVLKPTELQMAGIPLFTQEKRNLMLFTEEFTISCVDLN